MLAIKQFSHGLFKVQAAQRRFTTNIVEIHKLDA